MPTLTRCIAVTVLAACTSSAGSESSTTPPDPSSPDASDDTDAGGGDAESPASVTTLPLGTATVTQASVTCGKGAAGGAACMNLKISCPGIPDITVMLADSKPSGTSKGTIVAHDGGSGTAFYNGNTGDSTRGFAKSLTAAGFRFVQLAWTTDWASTGAGIKTAGCRPATLFRWIYDNIHDDNHATGFCGMGQSGGTAALLYSIAAYGAKHQWDYLQLAAGPTPARIDYGCDPSLYTGGARDLCPKLTNAPWQYNYKGPGSSPIISIVNGWEGTSTCDQASPPAADITTWASDSLVSAHDDLSYPQTSMTFWYCTSTPNMSTGQASFFIDNVHPKTAPAVNCYSGTCTNEEVFEDVGAFNLAVTDMTTKCVPNHQ